MKKVKVFVIVLCMCLFSNIGIASAYPYLIRDCNRPMPYVPADPYCYPSYYGCNSYYSGYYNNHDMRDASIINGAFNLLTTLIVINTINKAVNNPNVNPRVNENQQYQNRNIYE